MDNSKTQINNEITEITTNFDLINIIGILIFSNNLTNIYEVYSSTCNGSFEGDLSLYRCSFEGYPFLFSFEEYPSPFSVISEEYLFLSYSRFEEYPSPLSGDFEESISPSNGNSEEYLFLSSIE